MYAVKGNMQFSISEGEKKSYLDQGYTIIDAEGKVIAESASKTIPYAEHLAALEKAKSTKVKELEAIIAKLQKENEELRKTDDFE